MNTVTIRTSFGFLQTLAYNAQKIACQFCHYLNKKERLADMLVQVAKSDMCAECGQIDALYAPVIEH